MATLLEYSVNSNFLKSQYFSFFKQPHSFIFGPTKLKFYNLIKNIFGQVKSNSAKNTNQNYTMVQVCTAEVFLNFKLYIYIYIYIYMCVCACVLTHIDRWIDIITDRQRGK